MDGIRATPYINPLLGSVNELVGGLLGYMRDPRRTQQLQGLAGLLESTGVPKTLERLAYGEPLTNIQRANVPVLRPETAEALLTLSPVPQATSRAAMAAGRAGERMAERVVPQIMERGGMPAGLLESMSSRTVSPLTVYHGSPAKFERFDPTKIGSGEGAQSYGYGHYVAQSPAVAKDYQRRLAKEAQATDLNTKMQMVDVGGKPLTSFNVDMDAALIDAAKSGKKEFVNVAEAKKARWENLAQDQSYPFQDYAKQKAGAYTSLLDAAKKTDVDYTGTGMFYEIDLPDEQIARMLDWDKPLSRQPENVQAALEKLGYKVDRAEVDQYSDALLDALMTDAQVNLPKQPMDIAGEALYRKLGSPEQAAQRLREAGIPGIRYLDQGSRGAGEGTSNFVVFPGNEGLLTIQKRNNEVIAPTSLLDYRIQHRPMTVEGGASKLHEAMGTVSNVMPQKTQSIVREGNPIQSAVVLIGDKIFTGRTHTDAFNRAIYEGVVRKEGGKFIYPKDAEINSDLFMTKDGQIIDRIQASRMFDIGASETAIEEGLMQNKPAGSMSIDSYIEQAEAIKKQRQRNSGLLD